MVKISRTLKCSGYINFLPPLLEYVEVKISGILHGFVAAGIQIRGCKNIQDIWTFYPETYQSILRDYWGFGIYYGWYEGFAWKKNEYTFGQVVSSNECFLTFAAY